MVAASNGQVMNVIMSRVDEVVLNETLEEVFGNKGPKGSLEEKVKALQLHFHKQAKEKNSPGLMKCEGGCEGSSPKEFDHCPFCGATDEDEEAEAKESPPDPPKNGALAIAGRAHEGELVTERDLDASLKRVHSFRAQSTTKLWELGCELRNIYDHKLWMQRNDEKGKPKYKDFKVFVEAEVKISTGSVFRLIGIAREFDERMLLKHGQMVLRGLLGAPKDKQQEILGRVDRGEVKGTQRGIEREVARIREEANIEVVEGREGKKTEAATRAAKKKKDEKREAAKKTVTVPFPAERIVIEAFVRPVSKKDPPKRAKRLSDKPWGKHELSNGVSLYVSAVTSPAGEIKFHVEARREE